MAENAAPRENDHIDFLDVAAAVAGSWRSIVFIPLVAGAVAAAILISLPKKYESTMVLRSSWWSDTIATEVTLRPLVKKLNQDGSLGDTADTAISTLRQRVTVSRIGNDIVTVGASMETPEKSKQVLVSILSELQEQSKPRGLQKATLEAELADLKSAVASLDAYQKTLAKTAATGSPMEEEAKARSLSIIVNDVQAKQNRIRDIKRELQGLTDVDVFLEPTLPEQAASKRIGLFSVAAAIAAGLTMLAAALAGDFVSRAGKDPEGSEKIRRIKESLKLRRRSA